MTLAALTRKAEQSWREFVHPRQPVILVGDGTCGRAAGAGETIAALKSELKKRRLKAKIVSTGCLGLCHHEPLVEVRHPGGASVLYREVDAGRARRLVAGPVAKGRPLADAALAIMDGEAGRDKIPAFAELPVMQGQVRLVTRNCGRIDPDSLTHYLAAGGFAGLQKALALSPDEVIAEVERSGLRGRGGAGFPTGVKWRFARQAAEPVKYLICNADEGDPGAFMDRVLLESDPFGVLEGMIIAAYAIGAGQAFIYVRAEYPLAVARLQNAIAALEKVGLLGDDVLGSGFGLKIAIKEGAGVFVCGEETALMASLEGQRGMPRPRPPFPAQSGLFGKPTNINNVETFANVPLILADGAAAYRRHGTEDSPGTKTFALAGKIANTGLIEVPMGIKLRQIIYGIGGGIPGGKKFKAVQTGGPSGGCLPADCLDLPVDYANLAAAGSIMGSGGMIVLDEDTCIPEVARYFVSFTKEESCGKCPPCRLGTVRLLKTLEKICGGQGRPADLERLESLGAAVKAASLCGLGQTAPNPVLTTLRYFREEYEAHIERKQCPAGQCEGLKSYRILPDKCTGCTLCARKCPARAIEGEKKKPHRILEAKCIKCDACRQACRFDAVVVE